MRKLFTYVPSSPNQEQNAETGRWRESWRVKSQTDEKGKERMRMNLAQRKKLKKDTHTHRGRKRRKETGNKQESRFDLPVQLERIYNLNPKL